MSEIFKENTEIYLDREKICRSERSFVDKLRYKFSSLLLIPLISSCNFYAYTKESGDVYKPIGEEIRAVTMPPRINIVVKYNDGYLDIFAIKTCETREIHRTVEQIFHYEINDAGDYSDFGKGIIAITVFYGSGILLISNRDKFERPASGVTLGAIMLMIGAIGTYGIIDTSIRGIDRESYGDTVRQQQKIISRKHRNCQSNLPLILRTSRGIFPLGVTDENGHLRVRLEDIIPLDILRDIIYETASIEVGKI